MNVIFLAGLFPDCLRKEIELNSKGVVQYAADALQWSFVKGLDYFYKMKIINLPYIGSWPIFYKKIYLRSGVFQHTSGAYDINIGFVNLPILKHYFRYRNAKKELINRGAKKQKVKIVFVYAIHSPFIKAAVRLKNISPDVKLCLIVPDLPQYMSDINTPVHKMLKYMDSMIINKALPKIDYFVLLSDRMAEFLHVEDKPWVRVEGIFNPSDDNSYPPPKEKMKTVLYSGTLDARYGIMNLLSAFHEIKNDDYRLWICGDGECRIHVENQAKRDNRINYWGLLPRKKVLLLQKQATVLVNPRTSEGDYTKYSFPSKILEYLASVTPCIMHPLPGIPEEYYKYCFLARQQNAAGLKDMILGVCNKSQVELNDVGHKAASFIREFKNPKVQIQKVYNMINADMA